MCRMQQQEERAITRVDRRPPQGTRHLFHHGHDLVACIDGRERHRVLRAGAGALGQLASGPAVTQVSHYMTDAPSSVLGVQRAAQMSPLAYTVYGYAHAFEASHLVGFNGAYLDAASGHYPLGAGHRFYSPALMRFNSPDTLSPFSEGGINIYAYCSGDPINYVDPTGKVKTGLTAMVRKYGLNKKLAKPILSKMPIPDSPIHSSSLLYNEPGEQPVMVYRSHLGRFSGIQHPDPDIVALNGTIQELQKALNRFELPPLVKSGDAKIFEASRMEVSRYVFFSESFVQPGSTLLGFESDYVARYEIFRGVSLSGSAVGVIRQG